MKKIYVLFLSFICILSLKAQVCFKPPMHYVVSAATVGNGVNADFNNDGNIDLAVANDLKISVLLGSSTGTLSSPINHVVLTAASSIVSADFNNDGNADIVGICGSNHIGIFLGDGAGNFVDSIFSCTGGDLNISCADFNNDGKMDFATSNNSFSNHISIYTGNGNGTFSANNLSISGVTSYFFNITSADVNADGFSDIVTFGTHPPNGDLVVMINDGTGNFLAPVTFTVSDLPTCILVNDFTNDGKADLLYTINNAGTPSTANGIYVLPGNGAGGFGAPIITSTANGGNFAVVDFDGDGNLDLACAKWFYNSIGVVGGFFGNGSGTFVQSQAEFFYNSTYVASNALIADYNNDNVPDVGVVQNGGSYNISIILGSHALSSFSFSTTPISCSAANDGIISVTASGTGTPFQYMWNTGQTTSILQNIPGSIIETVTVTANDGCKAMQGTVFNPPDPISSLFSIANKNCSSAAFINLNATVTGGTPPLTYQWSTVPTQTTTSASNLSFGLYTLTVTDGHGCVNTSTVNAGAVARLNPSTVYSNSVTNTNRIVSADFNKDGIADLATCNDNNGNVSIMLGTGGGNFAPIVKYTYGTGNGLFPNALLVNDFNGDGNLDLAIISVNQIKILPGTGTGVFLTSMITVMSLTQASSGVTADFNGDAKADVAVYDSQNSKIKIFSGNGNNQFTLGNTYSLTTNSYQSSGMATADFNADGFADLATVSWSKLIVQLGTGNGGFSSPSYYSCASGAENINIADMNEDGKLDIVVCVSSRCFIFKGDGTGAFNNLSVFTLSNFGSYYSYGAVADFNGDGHKDVVKTNVTRNKIVIACGDGAGNLYVGSEIPVHGNAYGVCAADFDGDGQSDIATASRDSANINVILNCMDTGINNVTQNSNLKIYPNPSAGEFIIDTNTEEKQQLKIYDVNGKLILSKTISGNTSINLSDIQNGVYTISVQSAQQVYTSKLILVN